MRVSTLRKSRPISSFWHFAVPHRCLISRFPVIVGHVGELFWCKLLIYAAILFCIHGWRNLRNGHLTTNRKLSWDFYSVGLFVMGENGRYIHILSSQLDSKNGTNGNVIRYLLIRLHYVWSKRRRARKVAKRGSIVDLWLQIDVVNRGCL